MSDDRFHGRARWVWLAIMVGFIAVAVLELLGVRPR
ncbi:hypothetical protein SAMN05216275_10393 [Streptosporangium canum]|uniref:Uncharacterized protein n=1 Tax=Streptosporangium canum TaxID=324952 RepID=A0A1I3I118_9ACTN|nr:hypothetical protein SAMN05216275_10393 [Streptosporangium canum]